MTVQDLIDFLRDRIAQDEIDPDTEVYTLYQYEGAGGQVVNRCAPACGIVVERDITDDLDLHPVDNIVYIPAEHLDSIPVTALVWDHVRNL